MPLFFFLLYLYYTLFPGNISPDVYRYFTPAEVAKAREYHKINRLLYIFSFLIDAVFFIWLVFGNGTVKISLLTEKLSSGHYYLNVSLFFIILWLILKVISLPFSLYSYLLDASLGFSTQSITAWCLDYLKNSILDVIISYLGVILFFYAINKWRYSWWLPASVFLSIMLFIQNLIWPYMIAPLFNKFTPVKDPAVLKMVEEISKNAGININRVEVMDASRRTTRANAYFYGFGKNSRIVLYDTLLNKYPKDEIKAVIAHEAAHWKENHVLKSLLIGIIGIFIVLFILHQLLKSTLIWPHGKKIAVASLALVYLSLILISFDSNPIQNYISRKMEQQADLLSVSFLHAKQPVIELQVDLAKKSLLDVEPPDFIEWFSYTHPSTMHRIQYVEKFKILSQ